MDPDLAITICFVFVVLLFALGFAVYGVHEIHRSHAESATAPEPGTPGREPDDAARRAGRDDVAARRA